MDKSNTNTSTESQRARILARLREGSVTTTELIEELNVMRPGARIAELRSDGHPIKTHLEDMHDSWGRKHSRVARYYMAGGRSMIQLKQNPAMAATMNGAEYQNTHEVDFSPSLMDALPHQVTMGLLNSGAPVYALPATANSVAGFSGPNTSRRNSAPMTGAFFVPVSYGGCAWDTFGYAGFLECRSANLRTVAPISCLAATGDDSTTLGVTPMLLPTRNLLARAAAHRAMAKAALFSDSSAAVRVRRYNAHVEKARALESQQDEIRKRRVMRAYDLLRAEKAEGAK